MDVLKLPVGYGAVFICHWLTFEMPWLLRKVLLEAARRRREFRVVVVDARPETEGRQMMQVWQQSLGHHPSVCIPPSHLYNKDS